MFDNLGRRSFRALIILLSLFMLKNDKFETKPLVILLNFSKIDLINGTVNQIFLLSKTFLMVLLFYLILCTSLSPLKGHRNSSISLECPLWGNIKVYYGESTYSSATFWKMHVSLKFSIEMAQEIKSKYGTITKIYKYIKRPGWRGGLIIFSFH